MQIFLEENRFQQKCRYPAGSAVSAVALWESCIRGVDAGDMTSCRMLLPLADGTHITVEYMRNGDMPDMFLKAVELEPIGEDGL